VTDKRKTKAERFAGLAGFKDARRNALTGDWTAVYLSAAQGLEAEDKYAVVCEKHGTLVTVQTLRDAVYIAGDATEFCDDCRELDKDNKKGGG